MANERDKKLKELEESLAKELDQEVNLTKPSDSRLSDAVDLNPKMKVGDEEEASLDQKKREKIDPEASEAVAAGGKKDEVSLENVDEMLKKDEKVRPEDVTLDVSRNEGVDPVDLANMDQDILDEFGGESKLSAFVHKVRQEVRKRFSPLIPLFKTLRGGFTDVRGLAKALGGWGAPKAKAMGRYFKLEFVNDIKKIIAYFKSKFQAIKQIFVDLSLSQRLSLLGLVAVVALLFYLFPNWSDLLPEREGTYISSFTDVGKVESLESKPPMESIDSSSEDLEFVILVEKIAANLVRSKTSSRNPMAVVQFYIETSSQAGAVELKDREKEVKHIASRVLEEMKYDDLRLKSGKEKFKILAREALNKVVNNGRVKKIYFKRIVLKP